MRRRSCGILLRLALAIVAWTAIAGGTHAGSGMRIYSNVPLADMPPELVAAQADHLLNEGFLDVTKAPYNAANDGTVDVTAVLQQAIDDAFFNNLVVYFPKGTYLVSRQLRMEQRRVPGKPKGQRKFANILVGDDSGGTSPVIKLEDGASFDQDRLLQFEYVGTDDSYSSRATRHYNAALRGLAIDMGDNPTKTALSMDGAQYCVIEDVEIYGDFDIGIHGLPGSGGSVTNVTIAGGNIGIRQDLYRPSPSIQSVTLIGQRQYGIKLDQSRGPLVVSGFEIVGPRDGNDQYRAIWLQSREIDADPATANLVLSDGTIELFGEGPAIENFDQDMYLRNVYVNAERIASSGAKHLPVEELGGKAGAWTKVGAYMFINGSDGTLATLDGESFGTQGEDREYQEDIAIVDAPPDDLVSRHSWDQSTFPTYFNGAVVDVVKDYGVTRDDNGDDDAPLINQALRDSVTPGHPHVGKPVFLPRGHYHIASTVAVPAGAKLIGSANTNAVLHVARGWLPDVPSVAVQTENGDSDGTVLAHFAILGHDPSISKGMEAHGRLTLLHAQTNNTIIRDVQITRVEYWLAKKRDGNYEEPLTIFSGNMGGKVYNLAMDLHTWSNELTMGPRFRTLLIDGTSNPLAFYQPNVEAMDAGPQSEITGAKNVSFYAFKYEYDHKLLHIENSDNINIFGGSGNYSLRGKGQSIVTVSATPNYLLVNLERKPYKEKRDSRYDWITDSDVNYPASVVNVGMFGKGATTSYGELLGRAGGAPLN